MTMQINLDFIVCWWPRPSGRGLSLLSTDPPLLASPEPQAAAAQRGWIIRARRRPQPIRFRA